MSAKGKKQDNNLISKLRPSQLVDALTHLVKIKRPAFLWGPPGIGKSQIMKQLANNLGYEFIDIRLSQLDPTDLHGIPFPATEMVDGKEVTVMKWAPAAMLPKPGQKAIVLFDEMNTAAPSIQAAAYQIVLDRRLGEYHLPDDCVVFAAGNRETDRGATFKMATPLMNRFVHLELEVNFDDWQEHALRNMFHKDVVGFLTFQKQSLFEFEASSASRGFATPRSWEFVAQILKDCDNLPSSVLHALVAGCVGEGNAAQFMTYRANVAQLPNPADILSGKIKKLNSKEVSVMYALTTGLCYELKLANDDMQKANNKNPDNEKKFNEMSNNFLEFMMENFQPELVVLGARTALAIHQLPWDTSEMPIWERFTERYEDLILKA